MKEKCNDKEWTHCRVEKMGCNGCHYEDEPSVKSDFTVIKNTKEAEEKYEYNYSSNTYNINLNDIYALLKGKQLVCHIDLDKSFFIKMSEDELKKVCKNLKEDKH